MHPRNRVFVGVISASLLASVTYWEGTRYIPYEDVVGVLTVCQGYAGKDVERGKKYSKEECSDLLTRELKKHREGILKCINVPVSQHEIDAYTLFAYNVGVSAFCSSKSVLGFLNNNEHEKACNGMLKWVYADGKFIKGLYNRRLYETKMCLGGLNAAQERKEQ